MMKPSDNVILNEGLVYGPHTDQVAEHRFRAQRLIQEYTYTPHTDLLLAAQIHATLALVAVQQQGQQEQRMELLRTKALQ